MLKVLEIVQGFHPEWLTPGFGSEPIRPQEVMLHLVQDTQPTEQEFLSALFRRADMITPLAGKPLYVTYRTWERKEHLGVISYVTFASAVHSTLPNLISTQEASQSQPA